MKLLNDLSRDRLVDLLWYESETGEFFWRVQRQCARAGSMAGTLEPKSGYMRIKINGRSYHAHRLAWLYVHGEWPQRQIDHINRVRHDNRIVNLREVTNAENQQNTQKAIHPGGHRGVHWNKRQQVWTAKIGHEGRRIYLGRFGTQQEAAAAYKTAAARLHKFNPTGGAF